VQISELASELKQKEAQIAALVAIVEELKAKHSYFETVAARLEGVAIPQNVLVRKDRVIR
jgi:hypothetical protein